MKKFFIVASLVLATPVVVTSVSSCSIVKTLNTVNQISNIAGTASEISNVLGGTLGLSSGQKGSLTNIFSDYITGTNGIANLSGSKYLNQLGNLNFGTMGKLQNVLTTAQYLKLLNLGGGKNTVSSLMNSLTGGGSLSKDATSVLAGLLLNNIR